MARAARQVDANTPAQHLLRTLAPEMLCGRANRQAWQGQAGPCPQITLAQCDQ